MSYIVEEYEFQRDKDQIGVGTLRNKIGRRNHFTVCTTHDEDYDHNLVEWGTNGEAWDGRTWIPLSTIQGPDRVAFLSGRPGITQ